MPNLLATEPSAYLKSAAHQPVHWHPWGDAAFARARAEDKPILLDIGAVWCHWCHVMDGESYDNPEVAALLNDAFICIKVDRDERPDVDTRYQRAVQALTGQGGWPLTAFLTPEGEVFFGGTYFPPEDNAYGRPGFVAVLNQVAGIYRQQRGGVGELGRRAEPAEADVEETCHPARGFVQDARGDRPTLHLVQRLGHVLADDLRVLGHFCALLAVNPRHLVQYGDEAGPAVGVVLGG